MSRTFRRKNARHMFRDYVGRVDQIDSWDVKRYGGATPEETLAKKAAWFLGDNHKGAWNAPSWYRRERNRRVSRQNDHELVRCLKRDEWDDHQIISPKRDAAWYWF